jgi:hypothetical protein
MEKAAMPKAQPRPERIFESLRRRVIMGELYLEAEAIPPNPEKE